MPITMRNVCLERLETPGRTNTVQETRGFFFLFKATQGFYAEKKNKKQKQKQNGTEKIIESPRVLPRLLGFRFGEQRTDDSVTRCNGDE